MDQPWIDGPPVRYCECGAPATRYCHVCGEETCDVCLCECESRADDLSNRNE